MTSSSNDKLFLSVVMPAYNEAATIDAIVTATGWLPHTTRAALTGLRRRGYIIEKERRKDDKTAYRIVGEDAAISRKTRRAA